MADRYPGEIHIGGSIPRSILNELFNQIVATGTSHLGYCEGTVTEESVRKEFKKGIIFSLYDDYARYGRFDELEDFLVRHGIHFNLHCDAYCEYDAENVYYRGGKRVLSLPANQDGDLMVRHEEVIAILDNHNLKDKDKLNALTKLILPPEIKHLEPIRFI